MSRRCAISTMRADELIQEFAIVRDHEDRAGIIASDIPGTRRAIRDRDGWSVRRAGADPAPCTSSRARCARMIQPPLMALRRPIEIRSRERRARPGCVSLSARAASRRVRRRYAARRDSFFAPQSSGFVRLIRLLRLAPIRAKLAQASSSTVSSPAGAVSCGRNPIVADFSTETLPASGDASPRISEKSVDFPAPLGPTKPDAIAAIHLKRHIFKEDCVRRKICVTCEIVSIAKGAHSSPVTGAAQVHWPFY